MSEENKKPPYDEQTLARLLEAAYVLQEHSDELRALEAQLGITRGQEPGSEPDPKAPTPQNRLDHETLVECGSDSKATVAHVAQLQQQIEERQLNLSDVLTLVLQELVEMCDAAGAAIGLSTAKEVSYRAVIGIGAPTLNSPIPREKACGFPALSTGQVFRCPDVNSEPLIDARECHRRAIAAFIAVPVFADEGVAGVVELYFSEPQAFIESHVQTCQLMAGLVTDALSRKPKSLDPAAELAGLLAQLSQPDARKEQEPTTAARCYKCGHLLIGGEQFCGQCGAARSEDGDPLSLQSKLASLWHMKLASSPEEEDKQGNAHDAEEVAAEVPINVRKWPPSVVNPPDMAPGPQITSEVAADSQHAESTVELAEQTEPAPSPDWSSALVARDYLEQVSGITNRTWLGTFWNEHRGDIYLGISILVVLLVLRLALWNNRPVSAKSAPPAAASSVRKPAAPELPLFDRVLIHLGLADPPPVPENKGNPSTNVWVDVETGLYYCPNTDLYGKTPKGKYSSQREAQLDQFAPAYRKACD